MSNGLLFPVLKHDTHTLQFMKKCVSFFMPNNHPQWCNDQGNLTKSAIVNDLIQLVKKFEARREGAPSQMKRPLTQAEFLFIQRKLRSQNDWMHGIKYRTMNLWQFHLIQAEPTILATLKCVIPVQ